MLWDEERQEIWLDADRDRSFAGERAMRDFRQRRDVGTIGRDEPDTPERESFSFTVQVHPRTKAVAINVGNAGHATMVAGSAAGSRGTRGLYDGVAPGAQLVVIDYGGDCAAGFIEATIAAFKDPRVDVVLFEQNAFIALPYRVGDGRFTPSLVTTRLIAKYQKPFVVPGDNVSGLNVTSEHGNVRWGFAVGAYESKDSYRINDGYLVQRQDNLHHVGAWGPGGDGAVKPDILAPSGYLSSELPTATRRGGVKGLFRLPPGYGIGGGTSQATPTMAGALALLISAAKQEKVPYDAERIWRAMTGSARFLPDIPAHKQGNGVINVEAALALLRTYARTPPLSIISRGPVRTPVSAWLETPHEGVGLFEREGWKPGQRGERTLTLTRTTGPREPLTFGVSWLGNDGTFAAASSVSLPLGTAVPVRIAVGPGNAGPHSALLTLDHPSTPGPDYRVMAAVVASEEFAANDKFVHTKKDKLERPGPSTSYFLHVPPGVDAFTTTLIGGRVGLHDPIGRESRGGSAPAKIVRRPMSGVWEAGVSITNDSLDLLWTENPDAVAPPAFYTLTTTLLGATVETDGRLALTPGGSQTIDVTVTNRYGSFDGGLTSLPLAAVRTTRDWLGPREQRVFEITVPDGCPWLVAEAKGGGDGAIDLYVFDCTGKRCVAAASAVGHGMAPVVRHPTPKAGLWKVVVDAALVAGSGTSVEYMDAILDPSLGGVAAADAARTRAPGARWSSPVSVWLLKPPAAGRVPHAVLGVLTTVEGHPVPVGLRLVAIEFKDQTNVPADKSR